MSDMIEPYRHPRTQDAISADLHAAVDYRLTLFKLAADFYNCQLPSPIYVGPEFSDLIERSLPELPPNLKEALDQSANAVTLLEVELSMAYRRSRHDRL